MNPRIAILDYGVGNLHSVWHACKQFSENVTVVSDISEYCPSTHIVLPGVGAFDVAVSEIRNRKFDELINRSVIEQTPILGVCIGMHVLARIGFENGINNGLGIFDAEVKHLSEQEAIEGFRVPHIGWTKVEKLDIKSQAKSNLGISGYFYFAHSYVYVDIPKQYILSEAVVGKLQIPAVVKSGNAVGVQFHPEKSGINGLRFLAKFFETVPSNSAE